MKGLLTFLMSIIVGFVTIVISNYNLFLAFLYLGIYVLIILIIEVLEYKKGELFWNE